MRNAAAMIDYLKELFSKWPFMPHEHCFNSAREVLWVHVVGDIMTAVAYFAIPAFLVYMVRRRKDMQYKWVVALFAAFILSCGTTHIMAIIGMWQPYYRLEGAIKLFTGVISIATAFVLVPVVPAMLKLPSMNDLRVKNEQLQQLLQELRGRKAEQRKTYNQLSEAQSIARIGSWEWNLKTGEVHWSDEMHRIMGTDSTKVGVPGSRMGLDKVVDDDKEWVMKALDEGIKKGQFDLTHRIVDHQGRLKHVHSRGRTSFGSDGMPAMVTATTQDITDRVQQEHELRDKTLRLERSNEYLQRVSYATSHDLKEPLRGMVSYSQMVLRKEEGNLSEQSQKDLEYVVSEGKRLTEMVESLLNLSKLENSAPKFAETNLNAVLQDTLVHLNYVITEKDAVVKSDNLPTLYTDPKQLKIVFQNLISNSLKFNKKHPVIHISAEQKTTHWHFSVKDNGIGFKQEYKDQIFEIFQKLHSKGTYSGSGIGLAICKSIIESLGGEIWAESKPGKGTTVFFTLPV